MPNGQTSNLTLLRTGREAVLVTLVTLATAAALPRWWDSRHPLEPASAAARIPFELNEDRWFTNRFARHQASEADVLMVGDSVIWGAYVDASETLPAVASEDRLIANLGLNGGHPAALAGWVRYHLSSVPRRPVILHLNLLWMSSRRLDLAESKVFRFNHPDLVPQFWPSVPCYGATLSERLGVVVARGVSFSQWVRHLQFMGFEGQSPVAWMLENPTGMPWRAGSWPSLRGPARERPIPWTERGLRPQGFEPMELAESFQWSQFLEAVETLQSRGHGVGVMVGPLNEHLLTDLGRERYRTLRGDAVQELARRGVPTWVPDLLATADYADVSHPLAPGYRVLALGLRKSGLLDRLR